MAQSIDEHVGRRLFRRRRMLGLTQNALAQAVGVRFQQIQKYECGGNRVSASRLYELAVALQVSPSYFFEGLRRSDLNETAAAQSSALRVPADLFDQKDALELIRAYYAMAEGPRRRLLALAEALNANAEPVTIVSANIG